eukprot:5147577-Alexandrium_andersonii.AAC.1
MPQASGYMRLLRRPRMFATQPRSILPQATTACVGAVGWMRARPPGTPRCPPTPAAVAPRPRTSGSTSDPWTWWALVLSTRTPCCLPRQAEALPTRGGGPTGRLRGTEIDVLGCGRAHMQLGHLHAHLTPSHACDKHSLHMQSPVVPTAATRALARMPPTMMASPA